MTYKTRKLIWYAVVVAAILLFVLVIVSVTFPAEPTTNTFVFTAYAWEDGGRNAPAASHTFATFDRLRCGRVVERVCISWVPRTNRVGLVVATPGRNMTLAESLAHAKAHRRAVYAVSYPCLPDLFYRGKGRYLQLERGMKYAFLDHGHDKYAVNCIGAVIGTLPCPPRTGLLHGRGATEAVVKFFHNYLR